VRLLRDLVDDLSDIGPVEAHARGAFLQLLGAHQGGQGQRHVLQHAAPSPGGAFGGLDRLPIQRLLFGGLVPAFVAEDMGVARDHLVGDGGHDLVEGEMPRLLGHLRVVDRLQEKVAQLALNSSQSCRSMASATS
jgi:hypothetical protein